MIEQEVIIRTQSAAGDCSERAQISRLNSNEQAVREAS